MQQVTATQFKTAVELDPAWASKLTEPIEITEYCDMQKTNITHLSPLLHFTGKDKSGNCAYFAGCKSLKVAEGKFEGYASFSNAGIEKIGDLSCGKDKTGWSASFHECESLEIAEGKFEGSVNFSYSAIEKIGDLSCGKNDYGIRLTVNECTNLTKIPVTFDPKEIEADPKLLKRLEVDRFIQKKREEIVEVEI